MTLQYLFYATAFYADFCNEIRVYDNAIIGGQSLNFMHRRTA